MNTGAISSRYAKALLMLATGNGRGEQVYAQVKALVEDPDSAAQMELCQELQDFVALLSRQGRTSYIKLIFRSFLSQYEEANGIHTIRLVTASDSPAVREKLISFLKSKIDGDLRFECETDPALIGGFIVETGDRRLDASVSGQLRDIRRELIEKNKRIV